jgi:hypothetical protein
VGSERSTQLPGSVALSVFGHNKTNTAISRTAMHNLLPFAHVSVAHYRLRRVDSVLPTLFRLALAGRFLVELRAGGLHREAESNLT